MPSDDGTLTMLLLMTLAVGGFVLCGLQRACPNCKWLWARSIKNREYLGSRRGFATVQRTDRHFAGPIPRVVADATTVREEQVVVTKSAYRNDCHCHWCGHEWSFVSVLVREGW